MNRKMNETEKMWSIIESYFSKKHLQQLVKHQVESYNDFIEIQMEKTIEMFNPVVIHSDHDYISELNFYTLEIFITFKNVNMYRAQIHENNGATKLMFPNDARLRSFTYASNVTVDLEIKYVVKNKDDPSIVEVFHKTLPKVHIGKMPIMLKSNICILNQYKHDINRCGECKEDPGGYFIINGSEKTCLGQEKAADNKIFCFNSSKNNVKWSHFAEIKCVPDWKCISPKQISMMKSSKNNGFGYGLFIQIPRIKNPIPLFVLFRAMGIISDKDICKYIVLDINSKNYEEILNFLAGSIIDANKYITYEESLRLITSYALYTPINMEKDVGIRKKREFTVSVIENDLFPHCKTKKEKLYLLGYMANQLIQCYLGWIKLDERDSYLNKRVELTGVLINNLFRNYFNKLVKDMQKQVVREINNGSWKSTDDYSRIITFTNIYKIIKSTTIENGIKRALATGDFGIKSMNSNKVGVAQVLNRLTYISTVGHLRRINTPIDKSGKLVEPRKLHNSSWGFICPAETPEGQSVGVVKNISYMAQLTIHANSEPIYEYLLPDIDVLDDLNTIDVYDKVKVFLNGRWVGVAKNPLELYLSLKDKKYKGIINIYTSIVFLYIKKEIHICNDSGRLIRPVIKLNDNKFPITNEIYEKIKNGKLKWDDLVTDCVLGNSIIEYIDPREQENSKIIMNKNKLDTINSNLDKYTHCELHPSTMFGVLASCIPFPDHNQSPRNTYQCAMGKQAIGMYVTNFDNRMDKTSYVLTYPSRPLVDTRVMKMLKLNNIPSGFQVIVAIMVNTGYNQEDSIIFNKGSIDRGLFMATIYHTEKDEDKKTHGNSEIRCKPNKAKTKNMKFGNYDKINEKGVIQENTLVEDKDIIMAKVGVIKENRNDHTKVIKYEDKSRIFKTVDESYVDRNFIDRNGEGYNVQKTKIRALRTPSIGDKFSSRHGQKGTIGNIIPECDMPYTKDGLRPDIIINPHAIPSRMTIAQLKETILGKLLIETGLFGDGTSFGNLPIGKICDALQDYGYESKGNEILYNGQSGEQIETSIFMGPVWYQRLKHMVKDKQHSRAIGPMVNLTRQPAEGRSKDGGHRFGEMERDCTVSHGMARFTKDRMYDVSDKYSVHVCSCCGMIAAYNDKENIHICRMCNNRTKFTYVEIPYSCKLCFQELISINVIPRIITQ
jgi:DNA-directed RNA polymerase II subunit RPB2